MEKKHQGSKAAEMFGITEHETDVMAEAFEKGLKEFKKGKEFVSTDDLINLCLKRIPGDWPIKHYVVLGTVIRTHEDKTMKLARLLKQVLEEDD